MANHYFYLLTDIQKDITRSEYYLNLSGKEYSNVPAKILGCCSVHDDIILDSLIKFQSLDTINGAMGYRTKGLMYWGVTVVEYNQFGVFCEICRNVYLESVAEMIESNRNAVDEKSQVVHIGI